jgi:hypothetical protein
MTQLILNIVWKVVYIKYKETYLDFYSEKNTLKDWLWDAFKELKTKPSYDEGFERVVLQNDYVFAQLKTIDRHTNWNVLKRWYSVIDGRCTHNTHNTYHPYSSFPTNSLEEITYILALFQQLFQHLFHHLVLG